MLHENKLYTYYNLEKTPGIRVETTEFGNRYEFLDTEEVQAQLLLFTEGDTAKVRFYIPVIHCASCIWLLEHLQKLHPGIRHSSVSFVRKEVDITFNRKEISLRQLVELLASIHYIPDLSQSRTGDKAEKTSYKNLLYKIGVAGFVFLNVMTYSLPAYFNGKPVEGSLGRMLAILSLILVVPVVFFSGSDYFLSAWKNLKKKSTSIDLPIALGILVLFGVTAWEVLSGRGPGYSDSLAGLIFFLLVGKWYQGKSYEALSFERNYKSYFPIAVTRLHTGREEHILLEKVVVGDELLIRHKELIPADATLTEGSGMIDYSFVTGESTPVLKRKGDFLYAGGRQMGGIIHISVVKEVNQSHLTQLWNQDKTWEKPSDSLKNLTDRISKYFTLTVISIALAGMLFWLWKGDAHTAVYVFTAVLIIACPCALALSVPFTFGNAMRIFGRKGLYIKNTEVIERLSHVDTVVFDKTGTLTRSDARKVTYHGRELTPEEQQAIYTVARQSPHPLSQALAAAVRSLRSPHSPSHTASRSHDGDTTGTSPIQPFIKASPTASVSHPISGETGKGTPPISQPFTSSTTPPGLSEEFVEVQGRGIFGKAGGLSIRLGSEEYVTGRSSEGKSVHIETWADPETRPGSTAENPESGLTHGTTADTLQSGMPGMKISFPGSAVFVAIDDREAGWFTISSHYREGVQEVVGSLRNRFKLWLLSGDNDAERENLSRLFPPENLIFNCKPQDKARYIEKLQQEGNHVLMTGDGLNDAGALMQSDVALTVANTAWQFSPASDAVLESAKFPLLARFITFTHTARHIVYVSFAISFLYNLLGIGIALQGHLSPVIAAILMPVSSVSVVAFATLTTRLAGRLLLEKGIHLTDERSRQEIEPTQPIRSS